MATRNFPSISSMYSNSRYTLKKGQPYKGRSNAERVVAASRVINGESFAKVAYDLGCCRDSVRNWVKTLDTNNPRLNG